MTPPSQPLIAMRVAEKAHAGQFRRDGKTPYLNHVSAVAYAVSQKGADDITIAAAWLHDVFEDTLMQAGEMKAAGVSEEVIDVVCRLTRHEEDAYCDYIARVRTDPRARTIKLADMLHNLSDSPTEKQILKYAKGLHWLLG